MTILKLDKYWVSLGRFSGQKVNALEPGLTYGPKLFSYKVVSLYRPSYIRSLPSEEHVLLKPIPVEVIRDHGNGWIAVLNSAQVAMSGDSIMGAVHALEYYIVDVFDLYTEMEPELSVELSRQLAELKTYVRKK